MKFLFSKKYLPLGAFVLFFAITTTTFTLLFDLADKAIIPSDELLGKVSFLNKNGGKFNILFLGPSYIRCHIDIRAFDAEMAQRGYRTSSFSLSAVALSAPEELATLRMIKSMTHPAYIFIDPTLSRQRIDPANHATERYRRLQTLENTLTSCWDSLRSKFDTTIQPSQCQEKLYFYFDHMTNIGRLAALQERLVKTQDRLLSTLGPERNGFTPLNNECRRPSTMCQQHQDLITQGEAGVQRAIADLRASLQKRPRNTAGLPIVENVLREVISTGAEPILLLTPGLRKKLFPAELLIEKQEFKNIGVFNYVKPDAYPEFYKFEHLWNWDHYHPDFAPIFSKVLANEFADWLEKTGRVVPPPQEAY